MGAVEKGLVLLSRDEILRTDDFKTSEVYVEAWKGYVRLRELSGKERSEYERYSQEIFEKNQGDYSEAITKLIIQCAVDENNQPLFFEQDMERLQEKSSGVLMQLFQEACRLNKLGAEAVEELEKNYETTPDEPSVLS